MSYVILTGCLAFAPDALAQNKRLTPDSAESESALPQPTPEGSVSPRSPGMQLSPSDLTSPSNNPFDIDADGSQRSPEDAETEIREKAFNAAITGLLPLQTEDIRKLLERFDKTQQAVEVPVYPYPEPKVVAETLSLDPGSTPPVIKLAVGHVTTLTLLDATGAVWPISSVTWAGNFQVITSEEGGNFVKITPLSEFAYGNISINMIECSKTPIPPITFTLKTGRDEVEYRFDARIPEFGPYAKATLIDGGMDIAAGNSVMSAFLDGVPPDGAQRLTVSGVDSRTAAYHYKGLVYVRTPMTLLSPGWSSSVSSADGMNVYTVANAPVLLLSNKGKTERARLSEEGEGHE